MFILCRHYKCYFEMFGDKFYGKNIVVCFPITYTTNNVLKTNIIKLFIKLRKVMKLMTLVGSRCFHVVI